MLIELLWKKASTILMASPPNIARLNGDFFTESESLSIGFNVVVICGVVSIISNTEPLVPSFKLSEWRTLSKEDADNNEDGSEALVWVVCGTLEVRESICSNTFGGVPTFPQINSVWFIFEKVFRRKCSGLPQNCGLLSRLVTWRLCSVIQCKIHFNLQSHSRYLPNLDGKVFKWVLSMIWLKSKQSVLLIN